MADERAPPDASPEAPAENLAGAKPPSAEAPAGEPPVLVENPWRALRRFTDARIGLGRVGVGVPTREWLGFQLDHARARDAVHLPLDLGRLEADLAACARTAALGPPMRLQSPLPGRADYLRRPDLGRTLDAASEARLDARAAQGARPDLALVLVDGLSAVAVQRHAVPLLDALLAELAAGPERPALAPPIVVSQGRVAIGDAVGERLGARAVLVLIGERPGLSSPDSLGLYFTWAPRRGLTDARRNCVSNVRPGGLGYAEAARRAHYLLREAARLGASGVALKDRSQAMAIEHDATAAPRSLDAPPKGPETPP